MKYIVCFQINGEEHSAETRSIGDVKEGFWVRSASGEITKGLDGDLWIPPSQILHVKRSEDEPRTED